MELHHLDSVCITPACYGSMAVDKALNGAAEREGGREKKNKVYFCEKSILIIFYETCHKVFWWIQGAILWLSSGFSRKREMEEFLRETSLLLIEVNIYSLHLV